MAIENRICNRFHHRKKLTDEPSYQFPPGWWRSVATLGQQYDAGKVIGENQSDIIIVGRGIYETTVDEKAEKYRLANGRRISARTKINSAGPNIFPQTLQIRHIFGSESATGGAFSLHFSFHFRDGRVIGEQTGLPRRALNNTGKNFLSGDIFVSRSFCADEP